MDDVRGRFLGLPHGTTPAAVITNKNIKMSSFKSSANVQKKEGGPDRSKFLSLFSCSFLYLAIYLFIVRLYNLQG